MDDRFRISDADRDHAAARLRDHFAAGRLTAGELDERLAAVLNAKTFGDLRGVLSDLPEAGPAWQQPTRFQPDRGGLERGYRWLLACYPAAYRCVHEEEMLAVLMTGAPEGKRRPGIADAADLIWGALRVRCQPSRDGSEPVWRDALAVLSVVLPVFVLMTTAVQEAWTLHAFPGAFSSWEFQQWAPPELTAPLALLALALFRLQRAAALAAVAVFIWLAYLARWTDLSFVYAITDPYVLLAIGLQIFAVTASPGPRRGLHLLTWKHAAITVIAAVAVAITSYPLSLVVMLVTCAAMALASTLGRRLLMLLAIPVWPYVATPRYGVIGAPSIYGWDMRLPVAPVIRLDVALGWVGQAYLLPAVFLSVFVIAARCEAFSWRQRTPPSVQTRS
jgi:hypothetical protein